MEQNSLHSGQFWLTNIARFVGVETFKRLVGFIWRGLAPPVLKIFALTSCKCEKDIEFIVILCIVRSISRLDYVCQLLLGGPEMLNRFVISCSLAKIYIKSVM